MNIIRKILIITALTPLLLFVQCSDDYLDVVNPNEIDAGVFFNNVQEVELALAGVYASFHDYALWGHNMFHLILYSLPKTADLDFLVVDRWNQLYRNDVQVDNGVITGQWSAFYGGITRVNDFLANVDNYVVEKNPSAQELERLEEMKGEAMFVRGYFYFHLTRLWGEDIPARNESAKGVPLILELASTRDEMQVSRASVGQVYEQIISDFQEAENRLPDSWSGDDIARADSYAAKFMLAKVYMHYEDYPTARTYLEEIMDNGEFSLVPLEDYDGLFNGDNEFSTESIFEINFAQDAAEGRGQGGIGTSMAMPLAPKGTGWANVYPHDNNIRRFGNDPRLNSIAYEPGIDIVGPSGAVIELEKFNPGDPDALGWSFKKYVPKNTELPAQATNGSFGGNVIIGRLADVYLLYAEVLNAQGEDAMAAEYMNKVRRRAYGFDPNAPQADVDYVGLAGDQLRDSIREERYRELFGEGHRWYDIIRWRTLEEELAKYPTSRAGDVIFNSTDYYLPIPQAEIDINPELEQSTGF